MSMPKDGCMEILNIHTCFRHRARIWVNSGPGNNAKIEISQIWVKYGLEKSKDETNHNLPTMCMLWQYVGIGFETKLSKHGRQILADPENFMFMF